MASLKGALFAIGQRHLPLLLLADIAAWPVICFG
jgi:hypothetical protein